VLVAEAPAKSGALITARCAADEGREVLVAAAALDGSRGTGGAALAESGALPVGGAAEVLHEIGLVRGSGTGHAGTGPRAAREARRWQRAAPCR
jgi:DNA processing protein